MGWLFVVLAAISEFLGVIGLNKYNEKKSIWRAIGYYAGFGAAFAFLYQSFHYLQVSTAYAVWIGVGTAGAVLINMFFFGESKSLGRMASVLLIVVGVVGIKALS